MKIILLFFLSCVGSLLGCMFGIPVDTFVISTLYNAICIVFSVGMGLIVTFSLDGIKNTEIIKEVRINIKAVRRKFIILFSLCTLLLIAEKYWPATMIYSISLKKIAHLTTVIFFALSIGYFVYNFTKIQTLKDDIFDRLLEESKRDREE